jgi:hypothetical protein
VADFGHAMTLWHCCAVAGSKLIDFSQSQATTKMRIVTSQYTKHGTAEQFHSFLKGPMSDVTLL